MVQRSHTEKIVWGVVIRVLLLIVVLALGLLTSTPTHEFNENIFGYQKPSGFFGYTFADWELAWVLSSIFWGGIVFGTIGKKIDYLFISIFFLFAILDYIYTENVTPEMYLGLIGVAIVGNLIGYALKVARMHFFPSQSPSRGLTSG